MEKGLRLKQTKLAKDAKLRQVVAQKLSLDWSPEQIGWLPRKFPDQEHLRVSHETIYKSLFIQARGVRSESGQRRSRSARCPAIGKAT